MPDSTSGPIRPRRGTTLTELVVVLALGGVILGIAVPGGRRMLDRIAVTAAREEIVGFVHRTRAVAVASGGATLRLDLEAESVSLIPADTSARAHLRLGGRGIDLSTSGAATVVDLDWNALGWGVVTSRTLVLRRGAQEARVVISSRGRATRR